MVYIPSKKAGFAHPQCYLAHTNACSTVISGEHYISRNLLDKIEKENRTIDIMGLSWLPKEQLTSIGKSSLTAKVLCAQHNSALAPLDSEVGVLVAAISAVDAEYLKPSSKAQTYDVNGMLVEQWALKTLFGLVTSRQIVQKSGAPFVLKDKCAALLCSQHMRWPAGWGLYVATPAGTVYHSSSLELIPRHNPANGELLALGIMFNGISMTLLMGKPDNALSFGTKRPSNLLFQKGAVHSEIRFAWGSHKKGPPVSFKHTGTYSGPAPSHKLPRANDA